MTGTYDPQLNLVFFGTGNPGPDYYSSAREGDNLYTASLVALDADTGKLRWHYQFTPHDVHDWDSTQVPVLGDLTIGGQPRKVVMFANRNGFFYTLDRVTGKVIVAKPFVADHVGEGDRRRRPAGAAAGHICPTKTVEKTCPGSRRRHELHVAVVRSRRRGCSSSPRARPAPRSSRSTRSSQPGERYTGGAHAAAARSEELRRAARDRSGHRAA